MLYHKLKRLEKALNRQNAWRRRDLKLRDIQNGHPKSFEYNAKAMICDNCKAECKTRFVWEHYQCSFYVCIPCHEKLDALSKQSDSSDQTQHRHPIVLEPVQKQCFFCKNPKIQCYISVKEGDICSECFKKLKRIRGKAGFPRVNPIANAPAEVLEDLKARPKEESPFKDPLDEYTYLWEADEFDRHRYREFYC